MKQKLASLMETVNKLEEEQKKMEAAHMQQQQNLTLYENVFSLFKVSNRTIYNHYKQSNTINLVFLN